MHRARVLSFLLLVGLLLMAAFPALAQETTTDSTATETTVAGEPAPEPKAPAVSIVEVEEPEVLQPWTIRYLIPTSILIAGVLVFGTVVQYFMKVVRTRYKTVE